MSLPSIRHRGRPRSRLVWVVGSFYRPGMPDLLVEKRGHVMIATMNRPQRKNAMTLQMFGRMRDAWKEASADDDIRCIVLTGTGGDFSAGMDLRSLAGDADEHDDWDVKGAMAEHGAAWIYEGLTKTYRPTKPIIAAVEGVAIAGGTEILREPISVSPPNRRSSVCPRCAGRCTRLVALPFVSRARSVMPKRPTSSSPASTSPPPKRKRWGSSARRTGRHRLRTCTRGCRDRRRERPACGRGRPANHARDIGHDRGRGVGSRRGLCQRRHAIRRCEGRSSGLR